MVKYSLTENLLTERPDDYSAVVHSAGTLDRDAIIARMLQRGSLLTKTDIVAVLNNLEETIVDVLKEGSQINMPLFNAGFSINGVFESPLDVFDHARHRFNINLSKGTLIKSVQSEVKLEKTAATPPQGQILEVRDSLSGTVNSVLTPSGVVEIIGNNIKISGDNPECGLYFVPNTGNPQKATVVVQNKPSALIAMIPALAAGIYTIKVITQYTSGKALKEPRTYTMSKSLTVG